MAQLTTQIIGEDEEFRRRLSLLLRAGGMPVGIVDQNSTAETSPVDLVAIDIRSDTARGLATIERTRAGAPSAAIFAIAGASEPELILEAMRAGTNEFIAWPVDDVGATPAKSVEEALFGAVRRAAARRDAAPGSARAQGTTLSFLGAKGGAGTTTLSVNCAVDLARITKKPTVVIDLKASLGEVTLFLGVRPRFTLVDAIDNIHRLDRDFLTELVIKHKSGLEILAGAEVFDRPNAQDASAIEELLRVIARAYDYVVIDCGNVVNACATSALYASETIFLVANPDVASIRNAQRLLERVRELGAGSERLRVLLNRASDQLLITSKQIESALGLSIHQTFPSDYRTVANALNAGVPLALTDHSDLSAQFERFTHQIIGAPDAGAVAVGAGARRSAFLGMF